MPTDIVYRIKWKTAIANWLGLVILSIAFFLMGNQQWKITVPTVNGDETLTWHEGRRISDDLSREGIKIDGMLMSHGTDYSKPVPCFVTIYVKGNFFKIFPHAVQVQANL